MQTNPIRTWRNLALLIGVVAGSLAPTLAYAGSARIKDIVDIEGVRENQLVGYGLIVGLNGTGDSLNNAPFTKQSLQAMLERLGVNTRGESVRTANVAAVMGTRPTCRRLRHRARASTSMSQPSAMPTACRAAPCSSRPYSAPMVRSTQSPKVR